MPLAGPNCPSKIGFRREGMNAESGFMTQLALLYLPSSETARQAAARRPVLIQPAVNEVELTVNEVEITVNEVEITVRGQLGIALGEHLPLL